MPPPKKTATQSASKPGATASKGTAKAKAATPAKKSTPVAAPSEKTPEEPQTTGEIIVPFKTLDAVILKDEGDKIKSSGKWPLVIDPSGNAGTFLRYRNTNYMTAVKPSDMEPETLRRALLGSIRFGKIFVIDMEDMDMAEACTQRFDEIQEGLFNSLIDKSLLKDESYLSLVKEEVDGPEYKSYLFGDPLLSEFGFVLLTKNGNIPNELYRRLYGPIRVEM